MMLYCFADKNGELHYFRGKTEAVNAARQEARFTPSDQTIDVEGFQTAAVPTKDLVLRCLQGSDFIETNDDNEPLTKHIASIKGRIKPQKPESAPKPEPPPKPVKQSKSPLDDPFADLGDDEEIVTVWTKTKGYRPRRVSELRTGDQLPRANGKGHITW
jgi:hypothetical protein